MGLSLSSLKYAKIIAAVIWHKTGINIIPHDQNILNNGLNTNPVW